MSFLFGDPPTPPDPRLTAGAQTSTNIGTALANARLNNVNQVTPTGSLTYTETGNNVFTDPATGQTYNIPAFTQTSSLTPAEQAIQDQNQRARTNLATTGAEQSASLGRLLGTPLDVSGAPAAGSPSMLSGAPQTSFADTGTQQGGLGDAGALTRSYGPADDFSADRGRVEQALYGRLNPQLGLERQHIEQTLADQGIRYGSRAYQNAMDAYNRQANDARLGVTAASGAEQQRLMQMAQQQAQFQNEAQNQAYTQLLGRGQFGNAAQQQATAQAATRGQFANAAEAQNFAQQQAMLNAQNAARGQYFTEQYANRQEPINEVSALTSGGQVSRPQFGATNQTNIPTTDIASLINQNFNQNLDIFKTQSANTSALLGGILGAGGKIGAAYAGAPSDRRIKENISKMGSVFAADPQGDRHKLPIYQYSFKADPASRRHVGPMAQDVEKFDSGAVAEIGGIKHLDRRRVMGAILRAS